MKAFSFPELQAELLLGKEDLKFHFQLDTTQLAIPFFSNERIYPGQKMPILIENGQDIRAANFKWGLMLPWYSIGITSTNMFIVPIDQMLKRQVMHSLFISQRCIVLASVHQEWRM